MQRIKRQAAQFGLTLVGSRSQTKTSPQYGKLILVEVATGDVVMQPNETGIYWRTLEEIEKVVEAIIADGMSTDLKEGVLQ